MHLPPAVYVDIFSALWVLLGIGPQRSYEPVLPWLPALSTSSCSAAFHISLELPKSRAGCGLSPQARPGEEQDRRQKTLTREITFTLLCLTMPACPKLHRGEVI